MEVHIRYSQPDPRDVQGRDFDSARRMDVHLIKTLLPNSGLDFYLCGPPPFMKALYHGLREWGVPEFRIHYEFFGPASVLKAESAAPSTATADCCSEIEVTFARSGVTANWNPSLGNLLELAEAHGLSPDYSCRSGICHTCVCGLEAGEVEYVEEPVDPPEAGSVLICCSKPKTDVILDV